MYIMAHIYAVYNYICNFCGVITWKLELNHYSINVPVLILFPWHLNLGYEKLYYILWARPGRVCFERHIYRWRTSCLHNVAKIEIVFEKFQIISWPCFACSVPFWLGQISTPIGCKMLAQDTDIEWNDEKIFITLMQFFGVT